MKPLPILLGCSVVLLVTACGPKAKNVSSLQRKEAASLVSEAQFAITIRDYARAEGLFAKAAETCPDTGDYWINLGAMRRRLDNLSGAKKAYQHAAEAYGDAYALNAKQPELVLQQVYALALLGKFEDARAVLEKAHQKHPDNRAIRFFVDSHELDRLSNTPSFKELAL